jgi:iron(III) transport system permease protein
MLGAGRWRLFAELHLPLLRRSALAAALLVFVDVMKELPATLVLRPFGSDTLAVVAYNFARDERLAEAALPSLAIVAVGLIPVVLLSRALRAQSDFRQVVAPVVEQVCDGRGSHAAAEQSQGCQAQQRGTG